jgi:glycosyltransferase involved in cell wall biosynthesis
MESPELVRCKSKKPGDFLVMDVVVISHILPIPGVKKTNDFIFQLYSTYRQQFPEDRVLIFAPVNLSWNPFRYFKKNSLRHRLGGLYKQDINGFSVEILPFLSIWRYRNFHALITRSVYFLNRRRIHRIFSENRIEIIHARYIFSDGLLAHLLSKKFQIPYVVSTHNERFYFDHAYSRKVARRILTGASMVMPMNHSNYLYFKSIGIGNLERATHGFSTDFLREQKMDRSSTVSLFTVADLIKLKNIDKVILAISNLSKEFDLSYTIIGRGPEKDSLQGLVSELQIQNLVFFKDVVPHELIAEEMYQHDIYVMPSYFETFGRVYFEVMAMGIPIVCARNSGIYGIFKDGEEGLSVDHMDMESIMDALSLLISNREERLRIGKNGQVMVRNYTWENIARELRKKYSSAVKDYM